MFVNYDESMINIVTDKNICIILIFNLFSVGVQLLPKSRYGSISTYIYHCRGDSHCHRTFEVRASGLSY